MQSESPPGSPWLIVGKSLCLTVDTHLPRQCCPTGTHIILSLHTPKHEIRGIRLPEGVKEKPTPPGQGQVSGLSFHTIRPHASALRLTSLGLLSQRSQSRHCPQGGRCHWFKPDWLHARWGVSWARLLLQARPPPVLFSAWPGAQVCRDPQA